jgi:hypothetical protein
MKRADPFPALLRAFFYEWMVEQRNSVRRWLIYGFCFSFASAAPPDPAVSTTHP